MRDAVALTLIGLVSLFFGRALLLVLVLEGHSLGSQKLCPVPVAGLVDCCKGYYVLELIPT